MKSLTPTSRAPPRYGTEESIFLSFSNFSVSKKHLLLEINQAPLIAILLENLSIGVLFVSFFFARKAGKVQKMLTFR